MTNRTGTTLHNYTVSKEVKTIQVTTYTRELTRHADKESTSDTDRGIIRRAWC